MSGKPDINGQSASADYSKLQLDLSGRSLFDVIKRQLVNKQRGKGGGVIGTAIGYDE